MAKVDWITWKTNTNEIINPEKIKEKMDDSLQISNNYIKNNIIEELSQEISMGGLDRTSLNIMGISPANECANTILNDLKEIQSILEKININVYNSVKEQKEIEKEQLISSIEKKLYDEEKILNSKINLKDKLQSSSIMSQEELDRIIAMSADRIKKLKERLELARSI